MRRLRRGRGWRRRSRAKARRVRLRLRAGGVRRAARPRVFGSRRALRVQRRDHGRGRRDSRAGAAGSLPSEPLHVGDVPAGPANAAHGRRRRERREGVRRVRDVRVHSGYRRAPGPGGFEVRRRGPGPRLEVRPEGGAAGVLSLHVCGLHHGRRGGGQTAASGPADDAAVSGLSSRPIVGAGVAPGDCRARPGKRLANPRLDDDDDDRLRIPADDADAAVSVPTFVPTSTVSVSVRRGRSHGRPPVSASFSRPVPVRLDRDVLPKRGEHRGGVERRGHDRLPVQSRRLRRARGVADGRRRVGPGLSPERVRGEGVSDQLPGG